MINQHHLTLHHESTDLISHAPCWFLANYFFFLFSSVIDENGEKVRLVPVPIPVPTPVYIPVPMHLFTQYTPFPLGFPLPVCTDSSLSHTKTVL